MTASAAELFEPGEYLQPHGRPGTFSVLQRREGKVAQDSWPLAVLPDVVKAIDPRWDTWISQASFVGNNRRAVNLRDVGLLFADLDTYRSPGLQGKTPEEQAELLAIFCRSEGVPVPSAVLFSGRGLQAKWLLVEAQDPTTLFEWNQAQSALVQLLAPFSADTKAKDISRVLRLDQTINTKSGKQCRVIWTSSGLDTVLARYDFEELREALVDQNEHNDPKQCSIPPAGRRPLALPQETNLRRLAWFRLYDLRDLWQLRGGVVEGFRELTLFWQLCFLVRAEPCKAADLWKEAQALAAQIAPGGQFYRNSDLGTVYRKARATSHGEMVEYHGKLYPPVYTPRNTTLLELFEITSDEQRHLRTIIDSNERNRRRAQKRRELGMRERSEYEANSFAHTRPWEDEGMSRRTWYRRREDARSADLPNSPTGAHSCHLSAFGSTECFRWVERTTLQE